jgi:hypothetical protein
MIETGGNFLLIAFFRSVEQLVKPMQAIKKRVVEILFMSVSFIMLKILLFLFVQSSNVIG